MTMGKPAPNSYGDMPSALPLQHGPDTDATHGTLDQVISGVQALSRKLVANQPNTSVDDFLADRGREGWTE